MKELFELLGRKVRDRITGTTGVVDTLAFDVSGRVRAAINPHYDEKEAKLPTGFWVDTNRLEILGKEAAMPIPDFSVITARAKTAA